MTIQIELTPELQARMATEARARGLALESYAEALLERALASENSFSRSSQEEFREFLDKLAERSNRPSPAGETFTREQIYDNHD